MFWANRKTTKMNTVWGIHGIKMVLVHKNRLRECFLPNKISSIKIILSVFQNVINFYFFPKILFNNIFPLLDHEHFFFCCPRFIQTVEYIVADVTMFQPVLFLTLWLDEQHKELHIGWTHSEMLTNLLYIIDLIFFCIFFLNSICKTISIS